MGTADEYEYLLLLLGNFGDLGTEEEEDFRVRVEAKEDCRVRVKDGVRDMGETLLVSGLDNGDDGDGDDDGDISPV